MQHYRVERVIGDGSFGSVVSARHLPTNSPVAIKHLKRTFPSFDDAMREREVQALLSMPPHPHVVQLREVVYERQQLSLVFEHVQGNLLQWLCALSRPLPQHSIKHIMFQLLSALAHVHQSGVFHRDIKPENLLLQLDSFTPPAASASPATSRPSTRPATASASYLTPLVKLADFGQARDIRSRPPYSEYVSTRWYRAPEQLLRSAAYNSPIDVWAAGCICAELHTLTPLFAGTNEADTLHRIARVVPQRSMTAAGSGGGTGRDGLKRAVSGAGDAALDLMDAMLQWDPKSRISARDALLHPFFHGVQLPTRVEEERKEEVVEEYRADWDEEDGEDEVAVSELSADGAWLTVRNRFGELRCRHFPPSPNSEAGSRSDKQQQLESTERLSTSQSQQRQQQVASVAAKSGVITIAPKLDWPSFSDDSDDEPILFTASHSHSTHSNNSRSTSAFASDTNRYASTRAYSSPTHSAADVPHVASATRPFAVTTQVPPLPANSVSRPSSVLSTSRTRRSFASVGSQMF